MSKERRARDNTVPDFKTYYRSIITKHPKQTCRPTEENTEINPCIHSHLIFDKGAKE